MIFAADLPKTIGFTKQNLYFSLPKAILNVSQDLYSGSFQMHEDLSFCRLLDPRPENHQMKLHVAGFDDFWSQD